MNAEKQLRLKKISIGQDMSMLDALRLMDREGCKLLLVTDCGSYAGVLSAGDIQRAIISNSPVDTPINLVMRRNIRVAKHTDDLETLKNMMIQYRMEFIPVLDSSSMLVGVYFWDEWFPERIPSKRQIDLPVVVMAGGKGTRLKPFSNILPKPLFPLGEKTIIEVIMDKFQDAGCRQFLLSVNYRHEIIRAYFEQLKDATYQVEYIQEEKFSGTAGSLHLVQQRINETFFVSNCDIVIDTDYSEIVDYHSQHNNEITIVAALKHYKIPYGTLETGVSGQLLALKEKPEFNYLINAGLYVLEPHVLAEIPHNAFFHITDLIEAIRKRNGRIGVFPVSEKSWCDIGEWDEYRRTMNIFGVENIFGRSGQ